MGTNSSSEPVSPWPPDLRPWPPDPDLLTWPDLLTPWPDLLTPWLADAVDIWNSLQSVLNSAARLIPIIRKYDPISTADRRDLHWLPIQARIKFKLNVITRNYLVGQAPAYLAELCHSINEIPTRRNLRSATQVQLLVPRYRKERSGRRGFSISSPQLWNKLPADIRHLYREPQLFRKRLKTHYMQQSIFHHCGSMSPVRHLLLLLLVKLIITIIWSNGKSKFEKITYISYLFIPLYFLGFQ